MAYIHDTLRKIVLELDSRKLMMDALICPIKVNMGTFHVVYLDYHC